MEPMMLEKRMYPLVAILFGGTVFAWYNVALQLERVFRAEGTLFSFDAPAAPHPLLTPCFYGAAAFLVAFLWALQLSYQWNTPSFRWLLRLLLFGVAFASLVLVYEALEYYRIVSFARSISCSPGAHPLLTPCFGGLLFFTASYLYGRVCVRRAAEYARVGLVRH